MTISTLRAAMPAYAKDINLNLGSLAGETTLSDQQKYGCFLATALASRNAQVIAAISAEIEDKLSADAIAAAKTAAAIMGMNNIYYRFLHLTPDENYKTLPAKLRMNALGNPGIDKVDFELWALAVSAINGCSLCVESHEAILRKAGISNVQIQTAVRIASVVHAAAAILDGEEALAS